MCAVSAAHVPVGPRRQPPYNQVNSTRAYDSHPTPSRDAVVTGQLGFRFLRIDAIYTVQNDAGSWEREAAQMQAIYTKATLTLSALSAEDAGGPPYNPVQSPLRPPKTQAE